MNELRTPPGVEIPTVENRVDDGAELRQADFVR